jgi:hypothetical protein
MPRPIAVLCFICFFGAAFPVAASFAAEESVQQRETAQPGTRVEADDEDGVIRFFIKGQLAAIVDETGLHVREGIEYGGTIADVGKASFDARAAELKEKQGAQ